MALPITIGLTGGIASGKSTIATMFSRLGAVVLKADQIGHEVLNEEVVKSQIFARWGEDVFCGDGTVDRKAIASIVFDPDDQGKQLEILESITHPKIKSRIAKQIRKAEDQQAKVVILDAPLLFEAGWDELCTQLVFVKTPNEIRLARVIQRGWTKEQLENREQQQLSLEEKEKRSNLTIDNSGNTESTFRQVEQIWRDLGLSKEPILPPHDEK